MTFAAEEILSQDAQGRVLVSRERRDLLLEQYDRSGMSGVKFAEYIGIKYSTLAYWLQSRRRKREREKLLLKALFQSKLVTPTNVTHNRLELSSKLAVGELHAKRNHLKRRTSC